MPFFSSILLAASFLALPADTQPIPAAVPVPATLSPKQRRHARYSETLHLSKKSEAFGGRAKDKRDNFAA